jgi:hypothetical protein
MKKVIFKSALAQFKSHFLKRRIEAVFNDPQKIMLSEPRSLQKMNSDPLSRAVNGVSWVSNINNMHQIPIELKTILPKQIISVEQSLRTSPRNNDAPNRLPGLIHHELKQCLHFHGKTRKFSR